MSTQQNIQAIFFDIGDTLRERVPDAAVQAQATQAFLALVRPMCAPSELLEQIEQRYRAYRQWRQQTLVELREPELWTQWLLPDFPRDTIAAQAEQLTALWRLRGGVGQWRAGAIDVVRELHRRGYILGIVSNTISSTETPRVLDEFGLTQLFATIVLSAPFGKRKPDPELFWHAARAAHVEPNRCAYVGDRVSRDVVGARRAGFAISILIHGTHWVEETNADAIQPDYVIHDLRELLNIFCEE